MGILSQKSAGFVLSRFRPSRWQMIVMSLMLGVFLALAFAAKVSSPASSLADPTPKSVSTIKMPEQKQKTENQATKNSQTVTATDTNIPLPKACTKTQVSRPAGVELAGPGFVQSHETPKYYNVYGYSLDQVRSQLQSCAPNGYFAYTSYTMSWTYDFKQNSAGRCVVANVGVGIRTIVQYPSWQDADQSSGDVRLRWNRMMDSLVVHESGHVQRSTTTAKGLYDSLKTIPPMPCHTIAEKTKSVIAQYRQKLQQAHVHYDQETNHGQTQGAVL